MVISAPKEITEVPVKASPLNSNGAISNDALTKSMTVHKLPTGNYTLVSIDIDTTGRRLIDEIVQLAAFSPKSHFEQYIMPYMNLNPAARQRHQVRVISIGFYRMLKSMQTYKIIKSKSEIAALKDFLDWLEGLKAKDVNSLGVILLYHEERKFIPYMILQALKKYNLLDRFINTVAAFANSNVLAQNKLSREPTTRQPYTLRRIVRFINNKFSEKLDNNNNDINNNNNANGKAADNATGENAKVAPQTTPRVCGGGNGADAFDGNASVRARLTYEIAHYLCNLEQGCALDSTKGYEELKRVIVEQAQPIEVELQELKTQNDNVDRQNSFRPVFFPYFKATLFHRVRAVKFRIVLAENGFDLNSLQAIWKNSAHDGIISALQNVEELKPEERHELADLFDSYFDPKKAVIGPVVKNNRRRNRRSSATQRNGVNNEGNNSARQAEPGAGGDKQSANGSGAGQLPDSTTKSPIRSNGYNKSTRGNKRFNQRVRNGSRPQRYQQQQHVTTQTSITNSPVAVPMPQRVAIVN